MTLSKQMALAAIFYFEQVFIYCRCNDYDLALVSYSAEYAFFRYQIQLLKFQQNSLKICERTRLKLVCGLQSGTLIKFNYLINFSRKSIKLSKLLFCRASLWQVFLLLDNNNRSYKGCIKQTPPKQYSILVNHSDLREIDFLETSRRTTLIE